MAVDTNKNNPISEIDDEPTIELERLSEETCARFLGSDDAAEIRELREELRFRVEMNGILQHGLDQQRDASKKLQDEVTRLKDANEEISGELEQSRQQLKQTRDKLARSRRREGSLHTELEALANAGPADATEIKQESAIEELRKENGDLKEAIANLEAKLESVRQENADLRQAAASQHRQTELTDAAPLETRRLNDGPDASHWVLVGLDDIDANTYVVGDGLVTIGSGPDSDIQIESKFVSRHHAQLTNNGEGCVLEDLDSTNGTFINARRIKKRLLRSGDIVTIGKNRYRYGQGPAGPVAGRPGAPEARLSSM